MRKVVRGDETSLSYERKLQPMPKLGPWVDELERRLVKHRRRTTRIVRSTHILVTTKRDELIREGRGEELDELVKSSPYARSRSRSLKSDGYWDQPVIGCCDGVERSYSSWEKIEQ